MKNKNAKSGIGIIIVIILILILGYYSFVYNPPFSKKKCTQTGGGWSAPVFGEGGGCDCPTGYTISKFNGCITNAAGRLYYEWKYKNMPNTLMKNKRAESGMIIIILVLALAGWYFFFYQGGIHNPFKNSGTGTNPGTDNGGTMPSVKQFVKGTSCGNTGKVIDYYKSGCIITLDANGDGTPETYSTSAVSLQGSITSEYGGCSSYGQKFLSFKSPEGFLLRYGALDPRSFDANRKLNRVFVCTEPIGAEYGEMVSLQ